MLNIRFAMHIRHIYTRLQIYILKIPVEWKRKVTD